jgi:hypothetical protein
MRVVIGIRSEKWQFTEIFLLAEHVPIYLAIGKADTSVSIPAKDLTVSDPLPVLREALNSAASRDPDVGGETLEYLLQAPEEFLHRKAPANPSAPVDRWRVWPAAFEVDKFADRMKACPPADFIEIESHVISRILLQQSETL